MGSLRVVVDARKPVLQGDVQCADAFGPVSRLVPQPNDYRDAAVGEWRYRSCLERTRWTLTRAADAAGA